MYAHEYIILCVWVPTCSVYECALCVFLSFCALCVCVCDSLSLFCVYHLVFLSFSLYSVCKKTTKPTDAPASPRCLMLTCDRDPSYISSHSSTSLLLPSKPHLKHTKNFTTRLPSTSSMVAIFAASSGHFSARRASRALACTWSTVGLTFTVTLVPPLFISPGNC